ncbi:hypothetical protein BABINDRAFT_19496, partial [Babjeviella inositovora NRRL Y-12698]
PPFTGGSTPLSADVQARIMAFQQKRSNSVKKTDASSPASSPTDKPLPSLPPARNLLHKAASEAALPSNREMSPAQPPRPKLALPGAPNSPTKFSFGGAEAIQRKASLSARRGMKLPGGLPGIAELAVPGPVSAPSMRANPNRPILNTTLSDLMGKRGAAPNPAAPPSVPLGNLKGVFANYSKYVDIKSGSLQFAGKASLHSKGVDFSSGSSFHISFDELEVIEELGSGNYGTVSKVLHKPTGVTMAMKEVRLELDEAKFSQILMELDILHKCVSPYIVDFYGAFFVEGAVYMCIEYMDGGSLDKVYGTGVDEPYLAYIAESVIHGLRQLKQDHNIIHRDVKPTNILINSLGKVKLCDFGVSGNLVASLARTNIGCQSYMAPERIKLMNPEDVSYSVQSDIWSLGLSILEVAMGSYPYPPETYDNIFSQLSAIVDGVAPNLPAESFSSEARDFVAKCLSKVPSQRPSYTELLAHPWLKRYRD